MWELYIYETMPKRLEITKNSQLHLCKRETEKNWSSTICWKLVSNIITNWCNFGNNGKVLFGVSSRARIARNDFRGLRKWFINLLHGKIN